MILRGKRPFEVSTNRRLLEVRGLFSPQGNGGPQFWKQNYVFAVIFEENPIIYVEISNKYLQQCTNTNYNTTANIFLLR